MFQKISVYFIFLLFVGSIEGIAQSINNYNANSPYSRIGIGDLVPEGSIRNLGMGGTGVSQSNPDFLNIINPALLINNRARKFDSMYTILDGGIKTELRRISQGSSSQVNGTIDFFSLAYAFPISKRWVTAVNLRPFTAVSYSQSSTAVVAGTSNTSVLTSSGSGGIYRGDLSNAYRLNKHIHLGLSTSYLFGNISHKATSQILGVADSAIVGSDQKSYYSGFLFRPGVVYRTKLKPSERADSAVFINIGVSYDFYANMKENTSLYIERRTYTNLLIDRTKVAGNVKPINLPQAFRAGVSFDKFSKWNVAIDFTYYNYKNFNAGSSLDSFKNSYTIAAGVEYVINRENEQLQQINPFKRKYVRAGLSYTKTPFYIEGRQLSDVAFSLGYSFPVGKSSLYRRFGMPRPQINLALVYGQRGTLQNNLVKDQYFRAYVGLTLNDKWFKRRRVE
jgi:hypothetical protein